MLLGLEWKLKLAASGRGGIEGGTVEDAVRPLRLEMLLNLCSSYAWRARRCSSSEGTCPAGDSQYRMARRTVNSFGVYVLVTGKRL